MPLAREQKVASENNFASVLITASNDRHAESRATRGSTKDSRAVDETAPATPGRNASDDESTAASGPTETQDGAAVSDAPSTLTSTVPAATDASGSVGATFLQAGASSGNAYLLAGIPAVSASELSVDTVGSGTKEVAPTDSSALSVPNKQDRSRAQIDVKSSILQASPTVAAVDQVTAPMASLADLRSRTHGSMLEACGDAKSGAVETPVKGQSQSAPTVKVAPEGTAGAAVPDSTDATQPSILQSVPDVTTQSDFERLVLSDGIGLIPTGSPQGIEAEIKPLGKGGSAAGDAGVASVGIGAGGSKVGLVDAGNSPVHAGPGGSQATQTVQQAPSKGTADTTVRGVEAASIQGLVPTLSHPSASLQHTTTPVSESSHSAKTENLPTVEHLETAEAAAPSGINSAKIIQTMGETEMHVGMHSEEFGDISIRTSLSQQQMVTQISLTHNDLSQAISTHLSTVQAKLGEEYGLHASIEISNQGTAFSGGQADSSQRREQQPFARSSHGSFINSTDLNENASSVVALASARSGHGLDIRV